MKKILRRLLRLFLINLSRAVISKHEPDIVAITGDGATAIAREAVYVILHVKLRVRRNLEIPDSEFSIPLTVLGVEFYPKNVIEWSKVLAKTVVSLIKIRPYSHTIVIEIPATNAKIFKTWFKILKPSTIVICGQLDTSLERIVGRSGIYRISSKATVSDYLKTARTIARRKGLISEEIKRGVQRFELPSTRLRFLITKRGLTLIDSTYHYLPPSIDTVKEIVQAFDGERFIISDVPNDKINARYIPLKAALNAVSKIPDGAVLILRTRKRSSYQILSALLGENA